MADGIHRIRLIVGLGNPESKYAGTRHNAGFMFVERLLTKLPRSFQRVHMFQSYCWKGTYAGAPLIVQTPLTYMNLSGEATAPLMRSEGIAPDEVLVVHDDMDIPLGRIRIRKGGGSAGHNGINSLIEQIGSEGFHRMRIGVGHAESRGDVIDYVLSEFSEEERTVFDRVLTGAAEAAVLILRRGIAMAMNQCNPRDFGADEDSQPNKTTTETSVNNK
jgi:PTH1 family peptidyl-tRNA hydrolase